MVTFKVIEEKINKDKEPYQDDLICEVSILGQETKKIVFTRPETWYNYYISEEQVYVQLPTGSTSRSWGMTDLHHQNKVRKAHLCIQKVDDNYHIVKLYQVLDGQAWIISWVDSKKGELLSSIESNDLVIPRPIFIEIE